MKNRGRKVDESNILNNSSGEDDKVKRKADGIEYEGRRDVVGGMAVKHLWLQKQESLRK